MIYTTKHLCQIILLNNNFFPSHNFLLFEYLFKPNKYFHCHCHHPITQSPSLRNPLSITVHFKTAHTNSQLCFPFIQGHSKLSRKYFHSPCYYISIAPNLLTLFFLPRTFFQRAARILADCESLPEVQFAGNQPHDLVSCGSSSSSSSTISTDFRFESTLQLTCICAPVTRYYLCIFAPKTYSSAVAYRQATCQKIYQSGKSCE